MTFSELLKLHMEKKGLNQYQLSKLTGINQPTISRWLKDQFPPSLDKVYTICEKLGITISEFFSEAATLEFKKADDPQQDGYIAAIIRPGETILPGQAQAFAQAAEDQAERRQRLHRELDRLLDDYENKTPG